MTNTIYLVKNEKVEIPYEGYSDETLICACKTIDLAIEKANEFIKDSLVDVTKYVSILQEDWFKPLTKEQLIEGFKWYDTEYWEQYIRIVEVDLLG